MIARASVSGRGFRSGVLPVHDGSCASFLCLGWRTVAALDRYEAACWTLKEAATCGGRRRHQRNSNCAPPPLISSHPRPSPPHFVPGTPTGPVDWLSGAAVAFLGHANLRAGAHRVPR